jgi:hypothetical protein
MPTKMVVYKGLGIILVRLSGSLSLQEINQEGAALFKQSHELGIHKFLVDGRQATMWTKTWPRAIMDQKIRDEEDKVMKDIAFVVREEDVSYLRFLEIITKSLGIRVKIFTESPAALEWLGVSQNDFM